MSHALLLCLGHARCTTDASLIAAFCCEPSCPTRSVCKSLYSRRPNGVVLRAHILTNWGSWLWLRHARSVFESCLGRIEAVRRAAEVSRALQGFCHLGCVLPGLFVRPAEAEQGAVGGQLRFCASVWSFLLSLHVEFASSLLSLERIWFAV